MAQNDWWTQNLQPASLDGIVFEVASRRVTTGRELARYRYAYRDGQGVEDLGRAVYVWTLKIPLFRGVGIAAYPGTLDELVALVDDSDRKGEVEFVDPEWGPFKVKIPRDGFDWETVAEQRDGGILTLTLEEISFDQSISANLNRPELSGRTRAAALARGVDSGMYALGATLEDVAPGAGEPSLTDLWNKLQDAIDSAALAADDIAAKVDEVVLITQKVMAFSAVDEIERFSLYNSAVDFAAAAKDVGDAGSDAPASETFVRRTLPSTMSMYAISTWLYDVSWRADEILFNNPTPNPLAYPQGTTIKVFAT